MIVADNVSHAYLAGDQQVPMLHGISLRVREGEMVAVMGPSGSGKSTLLYCLAGLVRPTGGDAVLAGTVLSTRSDAQLAVMRRADVGFVFQSYNLMPTLSGFENVALPFRLGRKRVPTETIDQTLETVGLGHRAHALPSEMSGGEQQRVALARVLAQRPPIVFADEPTGALDTRTGVVVLDELVSLAHTDGHCVLTVTHDPSVAARCDRVLFLFNGRLAREELNPGADRVASIMTELTAELERSRDEAGR
ncbi:MAG: ABC transporter ATP-binding protein [Propionibacteriaceae bacterium]|nr:ABC transporter ATP-binding protein [Propionibacteriaceae bacterium]